MRKELTGVLGTAIQETDTDKTERVFRGRERGKGFIKVKATRLFKWSGGNYG